MEIIIRVLLTVGLSILGIGSIIVGMFAPMLDDDPRFTGIGKNVFMICGTVLAICIVGITATWTLFF
jgi:hypothetical protein